ncbi:hypothetical protein BH11BAC7_BH11BAC7_02070 [soil metagenome]
MAKKESKIDGAKVYVEKLRLEQTIQELVSKKKYGSKKRTWSDAQLLAVVKPYLSAENSSQDQAKVLTDFYQMGPADVEAFLSMVRSKAYAASQKGESTGAWSEDFAAKADKVTSELNAWTMKTFGKPFQVALLDPKAVKRILAALARIAGTPSASGARLNCANRTARPIPIGWDAGGPGIFSGMFTITNWPTTHNCASRYLSAKQIEGYQPLLPAGWVYHWSASIWPGIPGVGFRVLPGSDSGIYLKTWLWWILGCSLFSMMLILA